ncbi:hypothetical protein [uncultured Tateyamaria sp.]|uniref:hypothetical protein n=1 Tax=uncultured Tateyamaria sp. TaxID=455651 RepID=UPI002625C6CE|nr:hypothetical protein [uncultured Tateyamaria sp.]
MNDAPIRIGHPDEGFAPDVCGCCDGTELATLRPTENRPNLSAIAFRAGDHGQFKASMLTRLASSTYPALRGLGTREDDDFSIALIDAWASACDVLTFYQERLANEAYMGTATERLSIGELARLIGYRLHPGAAAETDLVILMEDPPAAEADVAELLVPEGTRVQSQPGPDEMPQVFETIEDVETRVAWNALRPQLFEAVLPRNGDRSTWLAGSPALQVGDTILFVSRERDDEDFDDFSTNSPFWDRRRIVRVELFAELDRTRITWDRPLNSVNSGPSGPTAGLRLFVLRDRASLFGYNAPHPLSIGERNRDAYGYSDDPQPNSPSTISGTDAESGDWLFTFAEDGSISLDLVYKSFVEGGWVVITTPAGLSTLHRIETASADTEARYALSGNVTRLTFDLLPVIVGLETVYRRFSVNGGSEELQFADTPVTRIVAGSDVTLNNAVEGLPEGRKLIFRGKPARLRVVAQSVNVARPDADPLEVEKGALLTLLADPISIFIFGVTISIFRVRTEAGDEGSVTVFGDVDAVLETVAADETAPETAVVVVLKGAETVGGGPTVLTLKEALPVAFDRESLRIHANIARAANGEGVTDILGSGDPAQPFQKFLLKEAPVTHRVAPTETGIESTLTLRVDGAEWDEVPDLYQRGASARVFKTSLTDAGETVVEFGDGISGARPLAGRDNIVADYSKGIGLAGNVRAGQLKLPLDRPLGLKETTNPLPATGGDDPERQEDARRNAPIYTLTLGRVVSLTDYRDFALGFPGIAKAEARWVWQGETRRIVVTVAGPGGVEIPEGSTTFANLLTAFRSLGDPLVGVDLLSYAPAFFRLGLRVAMDTAYDADLVLPSTEAALREAFSFEARDFGQLLALSEVAVAAHRVPGVAAIDVDLLYREEAPQTVQIAHARLISQQGRQGTDGELLPAEILTLSPGALDKLEVMS